MTDRIRGIAGGPLWWGLLVLPLWVVLTLCAYWEPVMGDGWGHTSWHRQNSVGLRVIYDFSLQIYRHENPRLGQMLTMLLYWRGPHHVIVTPLVELGVFAMLTALALGRWPSVRRSDHALVAVIVAAIVASCTPQIGPLLFYRPFTGNYTYGLALNLLWLVPYRLERRSREDQDDKREREALELTAARPRRLWLAPMMLALGLAAGFSNEHTGFAFIAMGGLATIAAQRRGRLRAWMIAGLIGLIAGYLLLLTAPGQHLRYNGLAAQATILERIIDRGAAGNLRVFLFLVLAMAWALPLLVLGLVERSRGGSASLSALERWTCAAFALAGVVCALTLLGSPKIGPRLYFASVALIAAGLAGWLAAQLRSRWARRSAAVFSAAMLTFVVVRLLLVHAVVGPLAAIRIERIQHGTPGSVVTVPAYPVPPSRYFLGDDFAPPRREALAAEYGLKAIELEASR